MLQCPHVKVSLFAGLLRVPTTPAAHPSNYSKETRICFLSLIHDVMAGCQSNRPLASHLRIPQYRSLCWTSFAVQVSMHYQRDIVLIFSVAVTALKLEVHNFDVLFSRCGYLFALSMNCFKLFETSVLSPLSFSRAALRSVSLSDASGLILSRRPISSAHSSFPSQISSARRSPPVLHSLKETSIIFCSSLYRSMIGRGPLPISIREAGVSSTRGHPSLADALSAFCVSHSDHWNNFFFFLLYVIFWKRKVLVVPLQ